MSLLYPSERTVLLFETRWRLLRVRSSRQCTLTCLTEQLSQRERVIMEIHRVIMEITVKIFRGSFEAFHFDHN